MSDSLLPASREASLLADLFGHGAHECLYFIRTKVPQIVNDDGQLTHLVRQQFKPIASPVQTNLVHLVREQLRPLNAPTCPPPGARDSRFELSEAITHRPQTRANGLAL